MITLNAQDTTLSGLFYGEHGNVVRTMSPPFTLSSFQWRGVWGERETGNSSLQKGYCANLGHVEDEIGLVYMRARYYEPATGRFISEDPARDGMNWYLYADGNPVTQVDYLGKQYTDDSFDPVYYFNFDRWWFAFYLNAISIPFRIALGTALGAFRGAIGASLMVGVTTAYIAASIVELYSLRLVAWYVFLFEELPEGWISEPIVGDLPVVGFYERPFDAHNIL